MINKGVGHCLNHLLYLWERQFRIAPQIENLKIFHAALYEQYKVLHTIKQKVSILLIIICLIAVCRKVQNVHLLVFLVLAACTSDEIEIAVEDISPVASGRNI